MSDSDDFGYGPIRNTRDVYGLPLQPGVNVDPVNVAAGLRLAAQFGYDDPESQMVIEYALMRHKRGEEAGAERTALSGGIDFTSWRAALAAASPEGRHEHPRV